MASSLIARLQSVTGKRYVHVGTRATHRFRKGYRYGDGEVMAAVEPGTPVSYTHLTQPTILRV